MRPPWNHNIHYHPLLLEAVPDGAARVLDVGCGEGMLARALRAKAAHVVGIDLDAPSLTLARASDCDGIEYVEGDFLTHPFEPASFDALVTVATLHHMDTATGLRRMAALLKPGGTLAIVGLARDTTPLDYALAAVAVLANRVKRLTVRHWEHPSPIVWPPPETWATTRAIAARELPGMRWRRHLYWRYSIVWTKPLSEASRGQRAAPFPP